MTRKKIDTSEVSDPSEGEMDSDDSIKHTPPQRKKMKREEPKVKAAPKKKQSPKKMKEKKKEEAGGSNQMDDDDDDDEQKEPNKNDEEEDLLSIQVPDKLVPCMAVEGGQRLLITHIEVENFKSYYGKRIMGPFHQSFTAIIGPNGSGKSNVIDALLFVFGYKASKIRSKKVSVLIHSSKGKEDLPSCTVTVFFQKIIDNPDGTYDVVPDSGFHVSRTAYRTNTCEYRMDGKKACFKEVAVRLKAVGIDLIHNRFLILQGEVEQIAMMKPKAVKDGEDGMLEYLEDIIGSSRFKVIIEKLTAKMEKLQEQSQSQAAKVNAASRAKKELDEPVQLQLAYMNMENEKEALNCKLLLAGRFHAESKVEKMEPEKAKLEKDVAKLASDLAEVTEQLKEKQEAADKMVKESAALQSSIYKTTSELESIVQKDKKRVNDLERVNKEMKKLEGELVKEQEKMEAVIRAPEEAEKNIQKYTAAMEKCQEEQTMAQEKFDEHFPEYNKQTEKDRARKAKLEEEYSGIAARLADANAEQKMAEVKLKNLMEDYDKRKAQLAELEKSLTTNREKLDKDTQAVTNLRAEMARHEDERKEATAEMKTIDERMEEIKKRLDQLAPLFTEKHQEAQARQTNNRITQTFESAVANGKMRGYIGQICDLGTVDAKYDRAISNNFNLDMYLVEDGRTASEGIDILKKLNLRTSFLSLDKQQHLTGQIKKIETEKNGAAPRLFNMIKCEEKYKPAFFFAIRGAYAVETMDDATALHRKLLAMNNRGRDNIVSMDGRGLITSKGTYVGGGNIKEGKMATGTARVARRESAVKEDEASLKKAEEAQREKQALEQERQEIGQRRRELEAKISQIVPRLQSHTNAAKVLDRQIESMEGRIKTQTEQRVEKEREVEKAKVDEKELEEKQTEIERLKKEHSTVNEESKSFKSKIKVIDVEMGKVYGRLVEPYENKLKTSREEHEKLEKDLGKERAVILAGERNKAKQQKKLDEVEKDLKQKREKAEELTVDEGTFEENKAQKQETIDTLEKQKTELDESLKTMRATNSELDTREVSMKKQQKELSEKVNEIKQRMKGVVRSIDDYNEKIAKLSLNNVAELLFDVPEDMRNFNKPKRYLIDGEDNDDVEDFDIFMLTPSRRKQIAEGRKGMMALPAISKPDFDDDTEDEEVEEKEVKKEADEEHDNDAAKKKKKKEKKEYTEMEDEEMNTDRTRDEDEEMKTDRSDSENEKNVEDKTQMDGLVEENTMEVDEKEPETDAQRKERKREIKRMQRERWDDMLKKGQMPDWSREHILKLDKDVIQIRLDDLEKGLAHMKKQLQPHILDDFKRKVERLRAESKILAELKALFVSHRDRLDELRNERLDEFMSGFDRIASALREMYQMITLGGDASLELADLTDPFHEGVQFMVRPPKKSWKQIENLSGGEKTLSSLALVFALHTFRPTPLYVMDEIDAALDFRNVSIIGHLIKERTKNAQFIIISLRNNMFELADRLVGIYKVHDCTRNVVVDPKKVIEESENYPGNERVRALIAKNTIRTGQNTLSTNQSDNMAP